MSQTDVYGFAFRGLLAVNALESTPCLKKKKFSDEDYQEIIDSLGINELDEDIVKQAQKMAVIYAGISSFENTVRRFVSNALMESFGDDWWSKKVTDNIKKRAETRRSEEAKVRWHTPRGDAIINYIDFSDLLSIIKNNWPIFEPFIVSQDWADQILKTVERSRNVIMHSGELVNQDIERLGMNIRDWIKQVGT